MYQNIQKLIAYLSDNPAYNSVKDQALAYFFGNFLDMTESELSELEDKFGATFFQRSYVLFLEFFFSTHYEFEGQKRWNITEAFLASDVGQALPAEEKAFFLALKASNLSYYEVLDVKSETVTLQDRILGTTPIDVFTKDFTEVPEKGNLWALRLLDLDGVYSATPTSFMLDDQQFNQIMIEIYEMAKAIVRDGAKMSIEEIQYYTHLIWPSEIATFFLIQEAAASLKEQDHHHHHEGCTHDHSHDHHHHETPTSSLTVSFPLLQNRKELQKHLKKVPFCVPMDNMRKEWFIFNPKSNPQEKMKVESLQQMFDSVAATLYIRETELYVSVLKKENETAIIQTIQEFLGTKGLVGAVNYNPFGRISIEAQDVSVVAEKQQEVA